MTHSAQKVTWKPLPPGPVVIIGPHEELGLIPSEATDQAVTEFEGRGALHCSGGSWHWLVRLCTGVSEHFLHTLCPKFSCRCFLNMSCFLHSVTGIWHSFLKKLDRTKWLSVAYDMEVKVNRVKEMFRAGR